MKKLGLVVLGLVLLLSVAHAEAWQESISWASQGPGITFNVWVCNWTSATTPCASWVTANAAPLTVASFTLVNTNPVLTEMEIEACGSNGVCIRRYGSGFFHDASRIPPLAPSVLTEQ